MLTLVDRDLWIADGAPVSFFSFPYPTRTTLVRLSDGTFWVCSPIALDDALARAVDALGPVAHLVSPNKLHHPFLGAWKARWPAARLYASPGLARRRRDLRFDAELGDEPEPAWAGTLDQVIFHGSILLDEVVFFHRPSRTAIVTDLVQRFDPTTMPAWRRRIMRLGGLVGPDGSTPREWRASFVGRRAARAARDRVLGWDPERVVIAHGDRVRSAAGRGWSGPSAGSADAPDPRRRLGSDPGRESGGNAVSIPRSRRVRFGGLIVRRRVLDVREPRARMAPWRSHALARSACCFSPTSSCSTCSDRSRRSATASSASTIAF